jgi:hypothetical protein
MTPRTSITERRTETMTRLALFGRDMKLVNCQMDAQRLKSSHDVGIFE